MASLNKEKISLSAALCLLLLGIAWPGLAQQETERERLRELEQQREFQKTRMITARMDSAIALMNNEQYEEADAKFRSVFANIKSIPSDLTFHFGKNSYLLNKYKQSIDWLTKYIQLKGTTGQYSTEAADWLKKAEQGLLQEHQVQSAKAVQILSRDFTIDCGPSGRVICPVCNGSTVVIKKTYLGDKYSTCGYCNKTGQLSCEDYNKLLRGELKPSN